MMSIKKKNPTRGTGLLEYYLAKKRIQIANSLIPEKLREGSVLDIGCGAYPYFLMSSGFKNRYGLEKKINNRPNNLRLEEYDIITNEPLPFNGASFDVITLLAVIEHIPAQTAEKLFKNIYNRLKPGGIVVITTPTKAADIILRTMAKLNLVSKIEIEEHVQKYTPKILRKQLAAGGFSEENIAIDRFEFGINLYAKAIK